MVLLLVAALMLLVDNDQGKVSKGRKGSAAHADKHLCRACAHPVPHVAALVLRQLAVRHCDIIPEPGLKALHQLRRQRNLRHEHQHLTSCVHRMRRRTQVNLCLTAARNALQQKGLSRGHIRRRIYLRHRRLLLVRKLQVFLALRRTLIAVAQNALAACVSKAALRQLTQHRAARSLLRQLAHAQRLVSRSQKLQRQLLRLRPLRQHALRQRRTPCIVDAVRQHQLFLQAFIINIIKQASLRIAHSTPFNARFARHKEAHRLRQRAHIIL